MIRKANIHDLQELLTLVETCIETFGKKIPERKKLVEHLKYVLQHEEIGCCFVAVKQHKLVGFRMMYRSYSLFQAKPSLRGSVIYVDPEHRGQKIARALYQSCKDYFEQGDYAYMDWLVSPDQSVTIKLSNEVGAIKTDWIVFGLTN